jgi:hypothetical protein
MGDSGRGAGRGIPGNWKMERGTSDARRMHCECDGPGPTWWSDVVRKLAEKEDDEGSVVVVEEGTTSSFLSSVEV